jgi:hypothetical protein
MMDLLHHDPDFKGGNVRFHALGASGANPFHLCVYSGIEQTDSSAWRQQAAYFKLSFVGLPVASISGKCKTFLAPWKPAHEAALRACECGACKGLNLDERRALYLMGNEPGSSRIYAAARLGSQDFAMSLDTPPIWNTRHDDALRLIRQNTARLHELRSFIPAGYRGFHRIGYWSHDGYREGHKVFKTNLLLLHLLYSRFQ